MHDLEQDCTKQHCSVF